MIQQPRNSSGAIGLKYDPGMATRTEVVAAESALAGAQKSLLDATCQHEVLKMSFEKPWAYAGTAGAVSGGGSSGAGSATGSSGGQAGSAATSGGS